MNIDNKFKIKEFEKDQKDFTSIGLDILQFVSRKRKEDPTIKLDFYDFAGEYYTRPEHFYIGNDIIYKKKQLAGEIPAEVILSYAYNLIGIPSPIAYPFFMSSYSPLGVKGCFIPDGVISKDIVQIFPTAVKRKDDECHTFSGLFNSDKCNDITREGKLSRIKETIASIAFNNKDAGYDNSFWIRDDKTGEYKSVVSIDHGYSGRDSMYGRDKESVMRGLYLLGEHGYNGMYKAEEDRRTVLYYLKRILAGNNVDGVQLSDNEIAEIKFLIEEIGKLDFKKIADEYKDKFKYKCSPLFMQALEWSREDLCEELGK